MPYVLISTNYKITSWDHGVQAPFDLDFPSADGSGSDWEITYDGNGTDGINGDSYTLAWDTAGAFGMGMISASTFISSRAGSVPS